MSCDWSLKKKGGGDNNRMSSAMWLIYKKNKKTISNDEDGMKEKSMHDWIHYNNWHQSYS